MEKVSYGLHNLKPPAGSRKNRKRVGRGRSAGGGKTCGRGTKGQKSRSGGRSRAGFEGGQMPLQRRIPKLGGFTPRNRVEYEEVNLDQLERFPAGKVVDPDLMVESGLVRKARRVKVLGRGELTKELTVRAHAFSGSAAKKIEDAGGKAEVM